jgi:AraC-like DNA-binding protein
MIVKRAADEISEKALEQNLANKIKYNYNINLNLARQAIINRAVTGLHINFEEASNLGLAWLCSSLNHLCIILSLFEKDKTEIIDSKLSLLNRQVAKICSQSISACVNAGVLITIIAYSEEISEQAIQPLKDTLNDFFREKGCDDVKLEYAYENDKNVNPATLYLHILQNSMNYVSPSIVSSLEKKNKQQIVEEILNIIHMQYNTNLTIESIAKNLHFTPNYIGSIFKLVKRIGINRYLNNYRLEKAKELLQDKEMQINDIAIQCGYDNITYFYTIFKKECGITPNEYRQQIHGEC